MAISKGMPMITTSKTMLGHTSHIGRLPRTRPLTRSELTTAAVDSGVVSTGCIDILVTSKVTRRASGRASPLHAGANSSVQLALNLLVGLVQQRLDVRRIIAVLPHPIPYLGTPTR